MDVPMVTYFQGKKLAECSNGEIVNAVRFANRGVVEPDAFRAVLNEAIERKILPDAMWLVNT